MITSSPLQQFWCINIWFKLCAHTTDRHLRPLLFIKPGEKKRDSTWRHVNFVLEWLVFKYSGLNWWLENCQSLSAPRHRCNFWIWAPPPNCNLYFVKRNGCEMDFRCEQGLNLRGDPPIGFQIQRLNLSAITAPSAHLHLLEHGERRLLQQRRSF